MYRLKTKEQRENVQKYEIDSRTAKGWQREDYKKLVILTTTDERGIYCLFVLCGTAAHPIVNELYKQEERRAQRIEGLKQTQDLREKRKEEEKRNPRKSGAAQCAAAIREELKMFKGVKFTVRAETFSMGDSVHIGWTDGPTARQVEEITGKYQYGHFNGMEDIYENSNSRDDIPQAKFVQTSRSQGAETRQVMEEEAKRIRTDAEGWEADRERNEFVYRLWSKTSIPTGAKVTGIERTDVTCGSLEEFYKLRIEGPEEPTTPPTGERVEFGPVQVIDYSQKAYAVIGDTKPIQQQLEEMGGKFNRFLSCGPGYIFSKRTRPIEKTTAALQALRGAIPKKVKEDIRKEEAEDQQHTLQQAAERTGNAALLKAAQESGRVMIVTPGRQADKVSPTSPEARAILREVNDTVKEASAGRVNSAQAMEEAADKIERIDTPKATETAASIRTMAREHRAKLQQVISGGAAPRMQAHAETKQMYLF